MLLATIRRQFTLALMSMLFLTMLLPMNILPSTAFAQTAGLPQLRCSARFFVRPSPCLPASVQASLRKTLFSHKPHQQGSRRTQTSSGLTVEAVPVFDLTGNSQTSFVPAETVIYAALINNTSANSITATFTFTTNGSSPECLFNLTGKDLSVPTGETLWYTISNLCGDEAAPGLYTLSVTVTDQNNPSDTSSNQGSFAVNADNLPYPSVVTASVDPTSTWWKGIQPPNCDTTVVSNSTRLDADFTYYRSMPACGPIGLPTDNAHTVIFPVSNFGEYEWQCVELSMRFMFITYGIPAYDSPTGEYVADNYQAHNPNNRILERVPNNTSGNPGLLPVPGDVLSYYANHTSVVLSVVLSTADDVYTGNGTIYVEEQNFSSTGLAALQLQNWSIAGVKNWLHHTLNLWPQTASPGSTVLVSGEGFQPNEAIYVYFDVFLTPVTADSYGNFVTTLTVPQVSSGRHVISAVGATTTPITQTVFYVP